MAEKRTKTELKEQAQKELMIAIANAIFMKGDDDVVSGGNDPELAEVMRKQGLRVMKLLGYESFQGVGPYPQDKKE